MTRFVLAIDGGGMHGIIPAVVLTQIERRTGRRIQDLFDLVVGTSTGALLAVGLGRRDPVPADRLLELYVERGAEIFPRRRFLLPWLFRPRYDAAPLERILRETLGRDGDGAGFGVRCMVTAYDTRARRTVFAKSWQPSGAPFLPWQMARASAAAPAYFAPYDGLVDGGVFANNPAMAAWVEARTLWPDEEIFVLSLGAGEKTRPVPRSRWTGLLFWSRRILSVVLDGQSDSVAYWLDKLLGENHVRLNCRLEAASDDFDDASPRQVRLLLNEAYTMLAREGARLDAAIRRLRAREAPP